MIRSATVWLLPALLCGLPSAFAQAPASPLSPPASTAPAPAAARSNKVIDVAIGQSVVRRETQAVSRIVLSDPEIAEIRLLEEGQYQIRGLAVGTTDLWVWYRGVPEPLVFQVVVNADLTDLSRRISEVVDGAPPRAYALKDRIVVEGEVPDIDTLERVSAIAKVFDKDFVNLMQVRGDHQVQLDVVFAEVSRTGLRELGMDGTLQLGTIGVNLTSPVQASGDQFVATTSVLGAAQVEAVLTVLERNSLSRVLAKPSLVAMSGQKAEFLAGGEVPIPTSQTGARISIEFKEYGVKVSFIPTVLAGDVIDMRAQVEYSELDSNRGTSILGVTIPGLATRKSSSHVRLEDGHTFAVAGMMSERTRTTRSAVPVLGDIPIVGAAFRHVTSEREEVELMIFVTPHLVRPLAPGEVPPPPGTTEDYNPGDFSLFLMGSLTTPGSRTAPAGPYGLAR